MQERLYDFFQPETLEGANAYWCSICQKPCRATKILSYTRTPTILIVHLERLTLGKKIQQHITFDITLNLEPYMTPGYPAIQDMKLIGIISHQGTKDNGHCTAMTKKKDEWSLYNDAITTQITTKHLHQTQAYVLIYRKTPELPIKDASRTEPPLSRKERRRGQPCSGRGVTHSAAKRNGNTLQYTRLYLIGPGDRGGGGRWWDERGRRRKRTTHQNGRCTRATIPAGRKLGPTP